MRRSLILASSTAIAVAVVMLASASPAAPIVICPVAGAHAAAAPGPVINCCGPPVAQSSRSDLMPVDPCCPGNALCARLLSIVTSPNPSTEPEKVTISGSVPSTAAATSVELWERLPGQSQFHKLLSQAIDGSGSYTITQVPVTNREWYVTAGSLRSTTIEQQVQALVTLTAQVATSGTVTLRAHVSPAHARQRLMLESRSGRGWTVLAHPRLDKHSRLKLSVAFSRGGPVKPRGPVTFRVTLPADSRNVQSSSAAVAVPQR